jgi:recombinational DNA repair protein (RecF pathway)
MDLQETFPAIRREPQRLLLAMYLADLLQHAVHEHDPHPTFV